MGVLLQPQLYFFLIMFLVLFQILLLYAHKHLKNVVKK